MSATVQPAGQAGVQPAGPAGGPHGGHPMPAFARDRSVAQALNRRRVRSNAVVGALCYAATAIGLVLLASILFTLLWRGFGGLALSDLTEPTRSPGSGGGLKNAIIGSLLQTALGTVIGTPIGLMVGVYLSEYARGSTLGGAVRFVSDVLLSAPSILLGLFVYRAAVLPFGGFSGIAGSLALAVIVIPIVVRTTEDMLSLIPTALREAAMALGSPKWKMVTSVCFRAARDGIVTGILLAIARVAGETAPLLFTSLGNLNESYDLRDAIASLPVTIYQYAGSAYDEWQQLAWVGALLITAGVLALNIVARLVLRGRS